MPAATTTPAPDPRPYSRGEIAVAATILVPVAVVAVGYVLLLGTVALSFAANTVLGVLRGDALAIGLVVGLAALFALCEWASRRDVRSVRATVTARPPA